MSRPSKENVFLNMALMLGGRALCARRKVGCILTDIDGRLVGSGYNGRISSVPNCAGENACVSFCEGMHAEVNALLYRSGTPFTAYVTCQPCAPCIKALVAAGTKRLVIGTDEMDDEQRHGRAIWAAHGYELLEVNCAASS